MILMLKLVPAFLGVTLPGYLFARVLRSGCSLAAAFPLSALLMTEFVLCLTALDIPLRFTTMALLLGGWSVLCLGLLLWRRSKHDANEPVMLAGLPRWFSYGCLGTALLVVLAVTYRATLYPLSGYDTFFRWEALARQMLLNQSLAFYPPVSESAYSLYTIPDGIPPLAATAYWWLYAAVGKPLMQATSISVALQLISCLGLAFFGAYYAFGVRAACFSLLACATSTLLINGFAIGQETGYTAVAVAGQFCFAWGAARNPRYAPVILSALFAALGALARDYGPVLALAGFLALVQHPRTRRFLPVFAALFVMLSAPWYLRTWIMTGNPLFPHGIPGGFPINAVYVAVQNSYHAAFAFYTYTLTQWGGLIVQVIAGAPLAIVGGVPYAVTCWRDSYPVLVVVLLVALLWLLSMGDTAGGPEYSMRVLTPAFVALSMIAGGAYSRCVERSIRQTVVLPVLYAICALYAVIFSFSHPFSPKHFFSAVTYAYADIPEFCLGTKELIDGLQTSTIPATGVLTSNAYLATILQRETRFRPVMIWSPEVTFVFDQKHGLQEVAQTLLARNIRVIAVQKNSVNDPFLSRHPLFRDLAGGGRTSGFKLIAAVGDEMLYYR